MKSQLFRILFSSVLLAPFFSAQGVLFLSTADPTYNTTAPGGALANSGWQYEGLWGSFLGTPIASQYFITAKHVGGSVGDTFSYQGSNYKTTEHFEDAQSDLAIWKVDAAFSTYAPMYTKTDEKDKSLVVIGRGTQRGAEVRVGSTLLGWQYGVSDGVQRWGENLVSSKFNMGAGLGVGLAAKFDANGLPNEAQLSYGDSGGAVFIQDGSVWKLAGINYGVQGPFSYDNSGSPSFGAALYDERGLYVNNGSSWQLVPSGGAVAPSYFVATSISYNQNWINGIVAVPEPSSWGVATGLVILASMMVSKSRR